VTDQQPPIRLETIYSRAKDVVGRSVLGEYILVPIAGHAADLDSVFHLNPLGSFVWERLDGKRSGQEIVGEIVEHFEVDQETAAADYRLFMSKLESIKVVVRTA